MCVCLCVVSSNDYVSGESRDFVFHTLNTVRAKSEFVIWYLIQLCVRETGPGHVQCSRKAWFHPRHYVHHQNNTYLLTEKFRVNPESAIT